MIFKKPPQVYLPKAASQSLARTIQSLTLRKDFLQSQLRLIEDELEDIEVVLQPLLDAQQTISVPSDLIMELDKALDALPHS